MSKESNNVSNSSFLESWRTCVVNQLSSHNIGQKVKVAGWVEDIRPLGSILFITLRDISGMSQIVIRKKSEIDNLYNDALNIPRQSSVSILGVVKQSKAKGISVELEGEEISLLSPAIHPLPIDPTGRVESSMDLRLNSRALDLRNPTNASIFKIRHTILQSVRKTLVDVGCIEVQTPKLIGQAAEGGASLFSLDYYGATAYLAQSPQLYKEQLTLSLDRVFEISDYFRAEKSNTRRHLSEFVSADLEAAYCDAKDVMKICEKMVTQCIEDVIKKNQSELVILNKKLVLPSTPFPIITYEDAINQLNQYGFTLNLGDDLTDSALKKLGEIYPGYFFIIKWPESLKPFYIHVQDNISQSFDLQFGYLELASGGQRISNREALETRMRRLGLDPKQFSDHIKSFDWGMPPHSGWGFGLDRFSMILTGKQNIREVVLYPRDQSRLTP